MDVPGAAMELVINGSATVVPSSVDPAIKLSDFLRDVAGVKSVKVGCGEGGCGACAVEVVQRCDHTGAVSVKTVNSCLCTLASVFGRSIVTSEGLGNSKAGFHKVQARLADKHGSQCGFCSPGMVVACHAALSAAAAEGRAPSDTDMEACLDGNLCRCTGYRPILDTCKSLAAGVDMEDLGSLLAAAPAAACGGARAAAEGSGAQRFAGGGREYLMPSRLDDVWPMLDCLNAAGGGFRVVAGGTGAGVFKNWIDERDSTVVDVSRVQEMRCITDTQDGIVIGGSVTISEAIQKFSSAAAAAGAGDCQSAYWNAIAVHLRRIAGHHVRNLATLGGHLALYTQWTLESDVITVMLAAGAWVAVADGPNKERWTTVEDFVRAPPGGLGSKKLVTALRVPWPAAGDVFWSERVAQRYYNSHSFVNCAMALRLGDGGRLYSIRVVLGYHTRGWPATGGAGGTGGKTSWDCNHVAPVEQLLSQGGWLNRSALLAAMHLLEKLLRTPGPWAEGGPPAGALTSAPSPGAVAKAGGCGVWGSGGWTGLDPFARQVAPGLLLQGLAGLVAKYDPPPAPLARLLTSAAPLGPPPVVRGRQDYPDYSGQADPVWLPVVKDKALLQASGEAQYTGDLPLAAGALHGAYVLAKQPLARIHVDAGQALALAGVVAFISAKDVPAAGANLATVRPDPRLEADPVFADGAVHYWGQPIGLVLATSRAAAERGAQLVEVQYTPTGKQPCITLQDAVQRGHFFEDDTYDRSQVVRGAPAAALDSAECTIRNARWYIPSQYHFYMEPQVAVVEPDEGGRLTVHSSCQGTDMVQQAVTTALGLPMHHVTVQCRRAGGGFGGKSNRSQPVAVAAAVAAAATGRQVRLQVDRNDDMRMVGGRCETLVEYSVGYSRDGRITCVDINAYFQGGAWMDLAKDDMVIMADGIDQVYQLDNLRLDCWVARTNVPPRTNMRAPGFFQASLVIEHIVEHVAQALGMDGVALREKNLMSHDGPLPPPPAPPLGPATSGSSGGSGSGGDGSGADDDGERDDDSAYDAPAPPVAGSRRAKSLQRLEGGEGAAAPGQGAVHSLPGLGVGAGGASGAPSVGLWQRLARAVRRLLCRSRARRQPQLGAVVERPGSPAGESAAPKAAPPAKLVAQPEEPYITTSLGKRLACSTFTLPRIWKELKAKAAYEARAAEVAAFNAASTWQKRGIAMTACRRVKRAPLCGQTHSSLRSHMRHMSSHRPKRTPLLACALLHWRAPHKASHVLTCGRSGHNPPPVSPNPATVLGVPHGCLPTTPHCFRAMEYATLSDGSCWYLGACALLHLCTEAPHTHTHACTQPLNPQPSFTSCCSVTWDTASEYIIHHPCTPLHCQVPHAPRPDLCCTVTWKSL